MLKATRWATNHASAVFAAVVLFLLAMVWLITSNLIIRSERDRTESYRQAAHATIEEFGSKLMDDLANVPGTDAVRRDGVQRILTYYQKSANESNNDPGIQVSLANAYTRMGSLCEELGQANEAISNYQHANLIYSKLTQNTNFTALGGLSNEELQCRAIDNRNHLALSVNNADAAIKPGLSEIDLIAFMQQTVSQSNSLMFKTRSYRTSLQHALTLNNYAAVLMSADQLASAQQQVQSSIAILEQLQQSEPNDQAILRGLSAAYHNLGKIVDDNKLADDYLNKAIRFQLQLARVSENRIRSALMLATEYSDLGRRLLSSKDYEGANEAYQSAVRITSSVLEIDPNHNQMRQIHALALVNQGVSCCRRGDRIRAADLLAQGLQELQAISEKLPSQSQLKLELVAAHNNYAEVLAQSGRTSEALEQFERGLKAHQRLAENVDPKNSTALLENYIRTAESAGKMSLVAELELKLKSLQKPAKLLSSPEVRRSP